MTHEEILKTVDDHWKETFDKVFDYAIDKAIEVINQCEDDDDWARFCYPGKVIEKLKALKKNNQ